MTRAGRQIHRRVDEGARSPAIPKDLEAFEGAHGPYIKEDRAEFRHACKEAQEWYIRLNAREVADLEYSIALAVFVRGFLKWTYRGVIAFSGALGAVYAFGEKLARLPETILGALSGISAALAILRGWFGQ